MDKEKIRIESCYHNRKLNRNEASEMATFHSLDLENALDHMRI